MSVVINTNSAATMAANNLAQSSMMLQKSLNRLSSGSRIVSPEDDAGGLAVSSKLTATAHRQGAVANNIANATSFLQTQDGVLSVVGKVLGRMSELKTLSFDSTKNASDLANYNAEFTALKSELTSLSNEKFNGISLFGSSGLGVGVTAESSSGTVVDVGTADLMGGSATSVYSDNFANLTGWSFVQNASVTGNKLTLASSGVVTRTQSVSGAFDVNFDVQLGASPSEIGVLINGFNFTSLLSAGSQITDTATHSVKVSFDGAGNSITHIDGSPTGVDPHSGLATTITDVSLQNTDANSAVISNFSITTGAGTPTTVSNVANTSSLSAVNLSSLTTALQDVATLRASNGASQSRLGFAAEVLATNKANIEAANSRIVDIDVAAESTQLARYNVLTQAGTAMLSQANQSTQIALKLLG
jgi:flagellin